MKRAHYYMVLQDVLFVGQWVRVYLIVGPTGQLYTAFDREEAERYRGMLSLRAG